MNRPLRITLTPGLPDDGAPGQWLGCDAHGAVYVLRWQPEKQCWGALGFAGDNPKPWPQLVLLREAQAGHIIGHVEGPPIATPPGFPRMRVGDLRWPAPRIPLSRSAPPAIDPELAEPASAWRGLFWLVWPALGAAALVIVALLVMGMPQTEAPGRPEPGRGVEGLFQCRNTP